MNDLKKQYRDLEMRVFSELRDLISKSNIQSKHLDTKCLQLDEFCAYNEVVICQDVITFIDYDGLHYNVFTVPLEDLIGIIDENKA